MSLMLETFIILALIEFIVATGLVMCCCVKYLTEN